MPTEFLRIMLLQRVTPCWTRLRSLNWKRCFLVAPPAPAQKGMRAGDTTVPCEQSPWRQF